MRKMIAGENSQGSKRGLTKLGAGKDGSPDSPSARSAPAKGLERNNMEKATFAAGCFWGVEAVFRQIEGVTATRVGYTGGDFKNPTYKDVCSGTTGHAEAVEVEYDPSKVTYEELLEVF